MRPHVDRQMARPSSAIAPYSSRRARAPDHAARVEQQKHPTLAYVSAEVGVRSGVEATAKSAARTARSGHQRIRIASLLPR